MEPFFKAYIAGWSLACLIALGAALQSPGRTALADRNYWNFLLEPWKLLTFLAGAGLITLVAPYTGDPTWDYVDGLFMSVFCYATAPWVVTTIFRVARREATAMDGYVAICAGLFSASWSYDIYLVWRDGVYPLTWSSNLVASSVIYLCAGLFWNLEWQPGRGVIFSFMRQGWPSRVAVSAPWRLPVYGLILALPAIAAVLIFFL